MSAALNRVGIHSQILEVFPAPDGRGIVRAQFRIDNEEAPTDQMFAAGDWLDVLVSVRVYDSADVRGRGALPQSPLAQGPEVRATARTEWTIVDLELPFMPRNDYVVVAKVHSRDDRYRKN